MHLRQIESDLSFPLGINFVCLVKRVETNNSLPLQSTLAAYSLHACLVGGFGCPKLCIYGIRDWHQSLS